MSLPSSLPVISAVIPVKSNLSGLKRTVLALHKLDPKKIEIIVIDGGGCPETKAWLVQHASMVHHMRSMPDRGIYDAMNYGKSCATAEWVWFVGAGDVPLEPAWKSWLDAPPNPSAASIHIWGVAMDEHRESGVPAAYPARWDDSMHWRNTTHHQGVVYSRALLHANEFDIRYRILADYALHLNLLKAECAVELHSEEWAQVKSGGASRQFNAALYWEEWRMKRTVLEGWKKWVQPFWLLVKYTKKQLPLSH